jgi:hypothetical protein
MTSRPPLKVNNSTWSIVGWQSKIVTSGKSYTHHGPTLEEGCNLMSCILMVPPQVCQANQRGWGRSNSKADAKFKASSQAVMDMIKSFLAEKNVSSEKRDERKRQDKEEAVKGYFIIRNKKLELEMNAHAREKETANRQKKLELARLTKEAKIMSTPNTDDMDLIKRAWLEKKLIHARDV